MMMPLDVDDLTSIRALGPAGHPAPAHLGQSRTRLRRPDHQAEAARSKAVTERSRPHRAAAIEIGMVFAGLAARS
jgi:hypothetical protein